MVIGRFIGSVINLGVAKVIPKGSKIEVAKAVKTAQGITNSPKPKSQVEATKNATGGLSTGILKKEKKVKISKLNKAGHDNIYYAIDKKLKEQKVRSLSTGRSPFNEEAARGVRKRDRRRLSSRFGSPDTFRPIGSLAKVVDFREVKPNSIGYPHGIKTSDSDKAIHQRKLMTEAIEHQAVERKLAAESRVTSFDPGTTAYGEVGGKDPLKDAYLKIQNSPYSPFEQRQTVKQHVTGKRHGATFWKKNQFGSTLRNKIEPPKGNDMMSSGFGGKIGEQSIEERLAEKLAGLGLGLGGAGIFGAFSYKKKKGSKNDRWGYW